jgi:DNA-binding MarR family transcriptional regulator
VLEFIKEGQEFKNINIMKTGKQIERHFKGVANHRRIDILLLVSKNPGITVDEISEKLKSNFKTVSEHTRRLVQAGLLNKRYVGRSVVHTLSPYGKKFVNFIIKFQQN